MSARDTKLARIKQNCAIRVITAVGFAGGALAAHIGGESYALIYAGSVAVLALVIFVVQVLLWIEGTGDGLSDRDRHA